MKNPLRLLSVPALGATVSDTVAKPTELGDAELDKVAGGGGGQWAGGEGLWGGMAAPRPPSS
jgi:hypothetical protein